MTGYQLGHLEHTHLFFAVKHGLEGVVSIDECFLLRILKFVLPDVLPKFLCEFSAWKRL